MKKLRGLITLLLMVLMLSNDAFANNGQTNFVVNPFTGESLGKVVDLKVDEESVPFQFNGKSYSFMLKQINKKENLSSYIGYNNGLRCVVASDGEQYNISIVKVNKSAHVLINDEDSISIYVCPDTRRAVPSNLITNSISESTVNLQARSQAYVHITGPVNIPFLISSGMAEGWLTYSSVSPEEYLATQVKYITNSGNVQLFYEWKNSVLAWISSVDQVTTIENGNWYLDVGHKDPAFQAEAWSTALVNNIPTALSRFDVVHLQ